MPKVSVLLSSYNHEKYVGEAIESVLGQTFSDLELIIFDDGSKDKSRDIISSYKDGRIRCFLREENRGPLVCLKEALEVAVGEYVAIHHSDDVWAPDKLAKQVAFLDSHKEYAACFTWANFIDEEGESFEVPEGYFYKDVFRQENRSGAAWLRHLFDHSNCFCHPSLVIRREMYAKCSLLPPPALLSGTCGFRPDAERRKRSEE